MLRYLALALTAFALPATSTGSRAFAVDPNTWTRLDKAAVVGRRWDVPLGYAPELKRFLILGGRSTYADYRNPRSYDVLTLQPDGTAWVNDFPPGKDWGPKVGACTAPAWKGEVWGFRDLDGNVRPNWTVYGTFSLGQKYDYDPDSKSFYFYAGGSTFKYEPAEHQWADLNPPTHPEKELGGKLLWSSMVYDRHNKQFVLFGGGNLQSERGDPGTWTYSPAMNAWTMLALQDQPPARANARLVYDPAAKKSSSLVATNSIRCWPIRGSLTSSARLGRNQNPRVRPRRAAGTRCCGFRKRKRFCSSGVRPTPLQPNMSRVCISECRSRCGRLTSPQIAGICSDGPIPGMVPMRRLISS